MAVIAKICSVKCSECGLTKVNHYVSHDRPETFECPDCGGELIVTSGRRPSAVLPGQFANDVNSELFVRPDKDHPGREMLWGWKKLEALADKGRTRPIQKREMQMVKDRMAHYNRDYGEVKI